MAREFNMPGGNTEAPAAQPEDQPKPMNGHDMTPQIGADLPLMLVYDAETTGLPLFKEPSEDPRQPHIVQLGALLVEIDTRRVVSSFSLIVRPDDWEIPQETVEVHGITTEKARAVGVPEPLVIGLLMEMHARAKMRLAHNEQFDARIVRIALKRYQALLNGCDPDTWKAAPAECTMRLSTPILQMPPTEAMRGSGRNFFKNPKLVEAYEHFFGIKLEGAHDAMIDCMACMEVYWKILDAA